MAFRKKAEFINAHQPDILIVPECEHPDKLIYSNPLHRPTDSIWYGSNKNKGLGVFSYNDFKLKLLDNHNPKLKTILPISVKKGKIDFTLFAIWANNPQDSGFTYIGQIWKSINYYNALIKNTNTILIGDFNSNTIWDKPRREGNHTTVVNLLEKKGLYSTYHKFFNLTQGKEEHSTLFMYRHADKPYHIDYCFASSDFISKLTDVEIGNYLDWKEYSDHTPLIITFNL